MMLLHHVLADLVGFWLALFAVLFGVVFTAGIGLTLLSREATAVWARFTKQVQSQTAPTQEVVEGLMLLVGGVCLLTPGYMTDIFGFVCVLSKSRQKLGSWLSKKLEQFTVVHVFRGGGSPHSGAGYGPGRSEKEPPREI